MKVFWKVVLIEISTSETVDGQIEASINRPNKFTSYSSISLASVERLRKLVRRLEADGYMVYGDKQDEGADFNCAIRLQ